MCPGSWKCFPTLSPTVRNTQLDIARLNILVFGLFICIWLHILSCQNNPTNKVYILQKRPCHLDQNWWRYVEIFILVKIDMLNILVFGLFICICLHILSFQNTPTNKLYILQKKRCYLDQNWPTVRNQEAGHPGKLATDFLQLLVLHEMSKKLYHWKAWE